jgi:Tfp pilus assembly protein PilW
MRTPGPGANSQLDAIRTALRANAMSDYMLMPEQVEAIMSEARAEGVEGVIELVKETVASADARDRLVAQLRAARARRSTARARQGRRDRPPDHPTGEYPYWAPEDIEALISGARAEVVRQAAELVTQAVLATYTRDRLLARLGQFQASDSRDAPPASSP